MSRRVRESPYLTDVSARVHRNGDTIQKGSRKAHFLKGSMADGGLQAIDTSTYRCLQPAVAGLDIAAIHVLR